jgi:hypothetical protein
VKGAGKESLSVFWEWVDGEEESGWGCEYYKLFEGGWKVSVVGVDILG